MKKLVAVIMACASACAFAYDWSGKTGNVVLTTGDSPVDITDADVATVNALTGLEIPEGVTVNLKNTTSVLEFDGTPALTGAGTIYGTAGAKANFSGDNRGFTGQYDFRASWITVTHEYGLGEATVNFVSAGYQKKTSRLRFWGEGLTCHAKVTVSGFMDQAEQKMTQGDDLVTFKAPFTTAGADTIYLPHAIFDSTFKASAAHNLSCGYDVTFNGAADLLAMGQYKNFWANAGVTVTFNAAGNKWSNPSCKFCTDGTFCFAAAGSFYSNAQFQTMQATSDKPVFDLHGNNASATYIMNYASSAATWTGYPTFTSTTPCTFEMYANGSYDAVVKFSGKVSHKHNGAGVYTIHNVFSDTSGTLDVPQGGVTFDRGAGWGGNVSIGETGRVTFETGAVLGKRGKAEVSVAAGGKIAIADGVALTCSKLTVGGVEKESGVTYTKDNLGDYIEGDGSLTVGGDDPLGDYCIWTGEGTGWSDPDSWEDGNVPEADSADAKACVPAGLTLTVKDADVASVAKFLGELKVDGALGFANTGSLLDLKAKLAGAGSVSAQNVGSGYAPTSGVALWGDNRGHTGKMTFDNSAIYVKGRYALGATSRMVTHLKGLLKFSGEGLTNDVPLYISGDHTGGTYKPFVDGTDVLTLNGNVQFDASTAPYRMSCPNVIFNGTVSFNGTKGVQYWVSGGKTYFNGLLTAGYQNSYEFYLEGDGSEVHVKKREGFWPGTMICGSGTYFCEGEDALPGARLIQLGASGYQQGHVDLGGATQQARLLMQYALLSGSPAGKYDITSAEPAQLFLSQPGGVTVQVAFTGAAGLAFGDPIEADAATAGNLTFKQAVSTTSGALSTKNGTVVNFTDGAAWYGDLEIENAGSKVVFDATAALNPAGTSKIAIANGGVLEVGGQVSVAELTIGGVSKAPGSYTAANQPGVIAGAGTVVVLPKSEKGTTHVWTGATDGDLSKASNWDAAGAPALDGSAEIVIGANAAHALTVPQDGLAIYGLVFEAGADTTLAGGDILLGKGGLSVAKPANAAEGLVTVTIDSAIKLTYFPEDGHVWTLGVGSYLVINGAISGGTSADKVTITTAEGAGTEEGVTLTGDNRGLVAPLYLTELAVRSGHEYALGGSGRFTYYTRVVGNEGVNQLKFFGAGLTNATPVEVKVKDAGSISTYGFHENLADELVMKGEVRLVTWNGANETLWLRVGANDRYEGGFSAAAKESSYVYITGAGSDKSQLTITGKPFKVTEGTVCFGSVTAHIDVNQNTFRQIYFNADGKVVCGASGVLFAAAGYNQIAFGNPYGFGCGYVDLGGLDQPFSTIFYNTTPPPNPPRGTVYSETDAYLIGQRNDREGTQTEVNVEFTGKAGFWQNGSVSNTISSGSSPTTGKFRVSKGGLTLNQVSLKNASEMLVEGGVLYIRATGASRTFGSKTTDLKITGGTMDIEGGTVRVKTLTVGEAKLPDGFYGALDCTDKRVPPENKLAYLTGAGVVRSGSIGLSAIVR